MLYSFEVLKPSASTVRLYVAGRREGMTYRPSVSLTAVREKAVPSWVATTLAEATAAPLGSVTLPAMLPKPCACENRGANRRAKRTISPFFFISVFPFRGLPATYFSTIPVCRDVPGASTTQLRLSHHELNATRHSLRTIPFLDSRYQLLE